MIPAILISGAGQLGSRYLQGLVSCCIPLRIYVYDCQEKALFTAKQRWLEVSDKSVSHEVSYHSTFDDLPKFIDIAIISTTANVRPKVVQEITQQIKVESWVLEKILAQSLSELDDLTYFIPEGSAWVNTPRRMMPWHQQIKSHFNSDVPLTLEVDGGMWGMACNAIHFLDLVSWWSGETLKHVDTNDLNHSWFESKRVGYWDIYGTLNARFSGGSSARLTTQSNNTKIKITVSNDNQKWEIDELAGLAKSSNGLEIAGKIDYQSEMSAYLIESILKQGECDLPRFEESLDLHRIFIKSMHQHWNNSGNKLAKCVPIT